MHIFTGTILVLPASLSCFSSLHYVTFCHREGDHLRETFHFTLMERWKLSHVTDKGQKGRVNELSCCNSSFLYSFTFFNSDVSFGGYFTKLVCFRLPVSLFSVSEDDVSNNCESAFWEILLPGSDASA